MPTRKRFTEDSFKREPWFRALCQALVACKTEEDMSNFLRDVATLSELQAWSERFEVAKQLVQGLSYRQVAKNTGASTTTVTRVAKFIENGEGGYRKILKAHRHHRMMKATGDRDGVRDRVEGEGKQKPSSMTLLQKYLEKGKN